MDNREHDQLTITTRLRRPGQHIVSVEHDDQAAQGAVVWITANGTGPATVQLQWNRRTAFEYPASGRAAWYLAQHTLRWLRWIEHGRDAESVERIMRSYGPIGARRPRPYVRRQVEPAPAQPTPGVQLEMEF